MFFRDADGLKDEIEFMKGAFPISDKNWRRLVEIAAELDSAPLIRVLVSCGIPLKVGATALSIAARNNYTAALAALLEAKAPIDGNYIIIYV
jgi:hypothetical protein